MTFASRCWRRAKARRWSLLAALGRGAAIRRHRRRLAGAAFACCGRNRGGIGQSTGPWQEIKLEDLAADVATVIEARQERPGVRGRPRLRQPGGTDAGNTAAGDCPRRWADCRQCRPQPRARRTCAQRSVRAPTPTHRTTRGSRRCSLCSSRRATTPASGSRVGIQRCWPRSASPAISRRASWTTPPARRGIVQPSHDPLARLDEAEQYKKALGDRVTVVVIANSAHAVIVEQPVAVSDALIAYARKLWSIR